MTKVRMIFLIVAVVVLAETGVVMTMVNARRDAPLGFWLWFGGVGVVAPIFALWLYRGLARRG